MEERNFCGQHLEEDKGGLGELEGTELCLQEITILCLKVLKEVGIHRASEEDIERKASRWMPHPLTRMGSFWSLVSVTSMPVTMRPYTLLLSLSRYT